MKKLTLFAVLALLAAVALPAMATDFSWSGEVTLGAITNFTVAHDFFTNYWLNLDGKVNDNLSWHTEFGFNPNFANSKTTPAFSTADFFNPGSWCGSATCTRRRGPARSGPRLRRPTVVFS